MSQKLTGNTNPSTLRLRNVCFTINNNVDHLGLAAKLRADARGKYFVLGQEVGESGTPHIQGYIEFDHNVAFNQVHKLLLNGHIEARKGTAQEASDYCKKDGEFIEYGFLSKQGERTDIQYLANLVQTGSSNFEIACECPVMVIRFHKGIDALRAWSMTPRVDKPVVRVYHGGTGTGKSHQARDWLPHAYIWHPQMGQWFDGYQGEDAVIFEEFRGQIPFGMILSLLDRYCCRVQYKGGSCQFRATKIAFTSPVHPTAWYQVNDDWDKISQLTRRISSIISTDA